MQRFPFLRESDSNVRVIFSRFWHVLDENGQFCNFRVVLGKVSRKAWESLALSINTRFFLSTIFLSKKFISRTQSTGCVHTIRTTENYKLVFSSKKGAKRWMWCLHTYFDSRYVFCFPVMLSFFLCTTVTWYALSLCRSASFVQIRAFVRSHR